jgi:hypothetical protein
MDVQQGPFISSVSWPIKSMGGSFLLSLQVSAVSPKTNTTSVATLGAFMEGAAQVVMYDTPGLVTKRCGLCDWNSLKC